MNASVVFVLLLAVFSALVSALPQGLLAVQEEASELQPLEFDDFQDSAELGDRFPRATCDLLSVSTKWGSVNHAACAAHCLAKRKGFKGGHCKDGVCHCRK